MTDDFIDAEDGLPPEIHLKLALDYLHSRAAAIDMPVTASLIGMAARAALDELREHAAGDEGKVSR